jgi:hypothetical protein
MSNVVSPYFEKLIKKDPNNKNKKYSFTPIPIKHVNYSFSKNINTENCFFDDNYDYYNSKKFLFLIDLFS